MRVIYSGCLRPQEIIGKTPARYQFSDGVKKPGSFGEGFGGEALVCLFADDDGQWFRDLCKAKDPQGKWDITFHAEETKP